MEKYCLYVLLHIIGLDSPVGTAFTSMLFCLWFCLRKVTYLLNVTPSNPLYHAHYHLHPSTSCYSSSKIWLLSNIQQTHTHTDMYLYTCTHAHTHSLTVLASQREMVLSAEQVQRVFENGRNLTAFTESAWPLSVTTH